MKGIGGGVGFFISKSVDYKEVKRGEVEERRRERERVAATLFCLTYLALAIYTCALSFLVVDLLGLALALGGGTRRVRRLCGFASHVLIAKSKSHVNHTLNLE